MQVTEGASSTFTVELSQAPTGSVTVSLASDNTDVSVSPSPLTFTTANWSTAQTVTVSAAADSDNLDDSAVVSLSASGGGYGSVSGSVAVAVLDTRPPAPPNLTAYAGDGQVELRWDVLLAIDQWQVRYREVAGSVGAWAQVYPTVVAGGRLSHTVSGLTNGTSYDFEVRGVRTGAQKRGLVAQVTEAPVAPPGSLTIVPGNLLIAESGGGTFTVALGTVPSADVTVSVTQAAATGNADVTVDKTSLTFTAGNYSTAQTVTVSAAHDADGDDDSATLLLSASGGGYGSVTGSVEVTVTDDDEPPAQPTGFTAVAGDRQVALNWTDPQDSSITKWQVRHKAGASFDAADDLWTDIAGSGASTTSYTVGSLSNNTAYVFQVRAVNAVGAGASSAAQTATPEAVAPGRPQNVTAVGGNGGIALSWDVLPEATGWQYRLKQGDSNSPWGSAPWTDIAGSSAVTTMHTITGLTNGLVYTIRVRAVRDGKNGLAREVSATPQLSAPFAPSGFAATPGNGQVVLRWDDSQDASITKWQMRHKAGTSFAATDDLWTDIAGSAASTNGHTVTGLTNGTQYVFEVRAVNAVGTGAESVAVTATPAPDPALTLSVASLTVAEGGSGTFTIALATAPSANVTVSVTQAAATANADVTVDKTSLTFTAGNYSTAQTVTLSAAHDDDGDDDSASLLLSASGGGYGSVTGSVDVTVTDDDEAPAQPMGFTATSGDGQVVLSWDDPADASISKWQVRHRVGSSFAATDDLWTDIAGSTDSTTSHAVTGLTNGTQYVFQVRAVNAVGAGAASAAQTATPVATAALNVSLASLSIDEGSSGTFTVVLDAVPTGDVTVSLASDNTDVSVSPSPLTFTTANWSTAQTVTVSAAADSDNLDDSAVVSLSASGGGYGSVSGSVAVAVLDTRPPAPPNLTAYAGDGQVELRWDVLLAIDQWQVRYREVAGSVGAWAQVYPTVVAGGRLSHTVSGLTNGTSYDFEVRGVRTGAQKRGLVAQVTEAPVAPPGSLTIVPGNLLIAESGGGTFTVALGTVPSADVTVSVTQAAATGNADVTVDKTSLTFTAGNYSTAQTVTVSAAHDADGDDDSATLLLSASGGGYGSVTGSVEVTVTDDDEPPAQPTGFTAVAGDRQVALNWTDPQDSSISKWQVRHKAGASFDAADDLWTDIAGSGASTTSHTVTGLSNGTQYVFQVRAVNAVGAGASSAAQTATPEAVAPGRPQNVTAVGGNGGIALSWDAQPEATGWQYRLKQGDSNSPWGSAPWTDIAVSSAATTMHTITGLTNGLVYTIRVRAVRDGKNGLAREVSATPQLSAPFAPLGFAATPGNGQVVLRWDDPQDASISKWQVRHKAGTSFANTDDLWTDIAGSAASTNGHTVTGLTNGTQYVFQVRAVNAVGAGAASADMTETPEAPNNAPTVANAISDQSVDVGSAVTVDLEAGGSEVFADADGDTLTYTASSGAAATATVAVDAAAKTVTVTGVAAGTATITVTAEDPSGASVSDRFEVTVIASAAPYPPPHLSAEPGDGLVTLSWGFPTGPYSSGFQMRNKVKAGGSFTPWVDTHETDLTVTVTGLTNGTEYTFEVRSKNSGGVSSAISKDATPTAAAPHPPLNVSAEPGDGKVRLSWSAPTSGGVVSAYQVQYRPPNTSRSGFPPLEIVAHFTTISYLGLRNGTEYTFEVRSKNSAGVSSAVSTVVTPMEVTSGDPMVVIPIIDHSVLAGSSVTVDIGSVFNDPDGDTLTYTATSEAPSVAAVSLSGTTLTVTGGALGTAAVTVTAEDPGGASVSDAFEVTVSNSLRTAAPTIVHLVPGAAQFTVRWGWTDDTGGVCLLTGSRSVFEVEYKKSTESSWLQAYEELPNSADRGVFELVGNGALRRFTIGAGATGSLPVQTGVALDPVAYDVRVLAYSGPCEQPPHEPNSPYSLVASTSVLPAVSNASVADGGVMSAPGQVLPGSGVSGLLTFAGQSLEALRLREGRAVREELPEAQGGEGALTYALSPALPAGLRFDADTRTISGTPLAPVAETRYTLTVTESEASAEATPQSASLSFLLEVGADTKPVFAQAVADMAFERNRPIEPRVLPLATGGEGELRYALEPFLPAGLYLDEDTRTISGTPETVRDETLYRWTAVDSDGDRAVAEFRMTVVAEPSVASRAAWAHKAILPDLVRGATDMTLDAVGARTQQARTGDTQGLAAASTGEAQLLGQRFTFGAKDNSSAPQSSALDSLPSLLQSTGPTLNTEDAGEALMQRMLEGASFRMHLGGGADGMGRRYTLWGQGGYRSLSAQQDGIAFSGGLSGLHLGADTRLSDTLLAGVAVSHSSAQMDYTETYRGETLEGVYGFSLSGVHPYADWQHASGLGVWLSAGASRGEVQVWDRAQEEQDAVRNALSVHALSGGVERPLARRGVWGLAFKADGSVSDVTVSDVGSADDIALRVSRLRMSVQADWELGVWSPYAELGLRHDGGAGGSGMGLEAGGGVRYSGSSGWQFEGEARSLALGSGSRREWQLQATLSRQPAAGAGGFRMRLSPAYGPAGGMSGVLDRLWSDGMGAGVTTGLGGLLDAGAYQSRLDLELGYGWPVNRGLVELYGGGSAMAGGAVNPAVASSGRLHVGGRFEATSGWHVRLELQWDGSAAGGVPSAPGGMNGDVFSSGLFGGASASGVSGLADERLADVGPHASEPGRYGDSLRALGAAPLNSAGRGIVLTISSRSLGR
ncbi:fibronectin type III domain-containing protein [Candidatus Foliamicus sp.]